MAQRHSDIAGTLNRRRNQAGNLVFSEAEKQIAKRLADPNVDEAWADAQIAATKAAMHAIWCEATHRARSGQASNHVEIREVSTRGCRRSKTKGVRD